jgi:hypothetical protein
MQVLIDPFFGLNRETNKKEARGDFLYYLIIFNRRACSVRDMHRQ